MGSENGTRLHLAMTGLIYPAFLGAVIYEGLPKLLSLLTGSKISGSVGFLIIALIILYSYDFVYTVKDNPKGYGGTQFLSDLLIVLCLYFATKIVFSAFIPSDQNNQEPLFITDYLNTPVVWLFLTKLLSVFWEIYEHADPDANKQDKLFDILSDVGPGILYFFIYCLQTVGGLQDKPLISFFTLVAVSIDIFFYHYEIRRARK